MFRDSFKAYNMDNSFSDLMPVYGRGLLNTMVFEKKENAKGSNLHLMVFATTVLNLSNWLSGLLITAGQDLHYCRSFF